MKTFAMSALKRFLSEKEKPPPPPPVVVNVDLSAFAKIMAETPLKVKHGTTIVPG